MWRRQPRRPDRRGWRPAPVWRTGGTSGLEPGPAGLPPARCRSGPTRSRPPTDRAGQRAEFHAPLTGLAMLVGPGQRHPAAFAKPSGSRPTALITAGRVYGVAVSGRPAAKAPCRKFPPRSGVSHRRVAAVDGVFQVIPVPGAPPCLGIPGHGQSIRQVSLEFARGELPRRIQAHHGVHAQVHQVRLAAVVDQAPPGSRGREPCRVRRGRSGRRAGRRAGLRHRPGPRTGVGSGFG